MTHPACALLLGCALLAASAALAEDLNDPHTLDRVTITGNRSVSTDKLMAVVQEHAGSRIVQSDIVADRDAIMKVLEQANVGGSVNTRISTLPKNKHLLVEFQVMDQGIQAPVVTHVAAKLHQEIFDGNKSIPTDKLAAASGLNPGDELTNQKVLAAQQAIMAAYKAAKLPVSVNITGGPQKYSATQYDLLWHVVETKGKAPKDERSQEAKDQIQ